jgi:L-Ala-D/L-Glu epimerase / N-acetyl-D-glutamate racemase
VTITKVRCSRVVAPLHTPFVTALRSTVALETLVVEIEDADGRRGFGEAPQVWRVTGESLAGAEACIAGPLSEVLLKRSPADLNDLLAATSAAVVGNFGAKAAVDVALHDLAARVVGVSLPRFLGSSRHQVPTDVTVSASAGAVMAAEAADRVEAGFPVLKLKVGGSDPGTDVARVRAVRDITGPDVCLRVDANQAWTPREAVTVIRALEDAAVSVEFVEQPVAGEDLAGLAAVTAAVDTPVMADESCFGLRDLTRIIEAHAADLVNVKLAKCGGLRVSRAMLEVAAACGVGTMVGSMMEGPVGVGAAASLVAAYGTTVTSDLDAAWWAADFPVAGGLSYHSGTVTLPDSPGLGIDGLR